MTFRRSPQSIKVLAQFLADPKEWKYGYDLSRETGLKSGSLYPILMRMAEYGLLERRWEIPESGKPRHMYKLASGGLKYAREVVPASSRLRGFQPALNGVKS